MKQRTRIPRKRSNPRRKRPWLFSKRERDPRFLDPRSYVTKGGRVRLFGEDMDRLRNAAYERAFSWAYGIPICECGCGLPAWWWDDNIFAQGEVSHSEHGARKSDELHRVKWKRHECHMKSHNAGGKPCPRKAA